MKYQFKGFAGKWNVYDEAGAWIGKLRHGIGAKLELEYDGTTNTWQLCREKESVWLEQDGRPGLTGGFTYPAKADGTVVQEFLFAPPRAEWLKLVRQEEAWSLHQLQNRDVEIYQNDSRVGVLKGLVTGKKILEWSGAEKDLGMGLLCFLLGRYMVEDDTVYTV